MSVKPIFPRILDPSMLPGDDAAAPVAEEEQHGLFTTIYENKMIVIIIVLVILIIGIFAYVVIRKKEDPVETEQLQPAPPQQQPQLPQQPPQQRPRDYNNEELRKMMGEMEAAKGKVAQQRRQPPVETTDTPTRNDPVGDDAQSNDDNIVEYMKEAAMEKPDDFDDKALKIIDEQAGLSESTSSVICGAPTAAGGSCKLRAVVDGRCRKHIGV